MKHYLEHKISSHIQSLSKRLLGRFGLSVSFQTIRLLGLRKFLLRHVTITDREQKTVSQIESAMCKLSLWQSLTGGWLAGEVRISNFCTDFEAIAKKEFTLSDILITLGISRRKAAILVETNGISFLSNIYRKNGQIKVLSEISISWDSYISIMGDHLNFSYLKNFHSATPVLINSLLIFTKNREQSVFFNGILKADDFTLIPVKERKPSTLTIDKQFLLNILFAKHGRNYFSANNYVHYHKIPEYLINAIICTEDPGFWAHRGIDPAFVGYALTANLKSQRFERGASTITMQLVRNLFLNHDKNILRKVEECVIALLIENYFKIEKKDILEIYLNLIEFAPNVYGLHHACRFYFGKSYSELSLTESLVLTYIIPRPKHFYEALLEKSEQLRGNLHRHVQQYATAMLHKQFITPNDYNNISSTIVFSSQFGTITIPDLVKNKKRVALTIDDLPFISAHSPIKLEKMAEATNILLHRLNQHNVKTTGFVVGNMVDVAGEYEDRLNLLSQWQADGHILANHSYSHLPLSKISSDDFEKEVIKNEKILGILLETNPVEYSYFRFPCLDHGDTPQKRRKAMDFLERRSYTVAPVTIDAKDYIYDTLYTKAKLHDDIDVIQSIIGKYLEYLKTIIEFREQQAIRFFSRPLGQIMLIHANQINAYCLHLVIALLKQHDYEIVPLYEILKEPCYQHGFATINHGEFLSWEVQSSDGKQTHVAFPKIDPKILETYKKCLSSKNIESNEN